MAYLLLPTTRLVVRKTSCETMGPWRLPKTQSRRDQISHFRRVVAVSAKRLEVGQVSRRRVVAVFGDGWLPSLTSGWVLDRDLGDGWLPSSETGGCRLRPVLGSWSGISETGGCRLRRRVVTVSSRKKVGKATWISGSSVRPFPGACFLVSCVCGRPWPLAFCSGSVCGSGPVVCSWPCCVVWFRPPGLFQKRGDDPGHRPKDRVFRPWWSK